MSYLFKSYLLILLFSIGQEKKLSNGCLNPIYDPKKNNALIELKDVCVKWVPKSNEYSIENISLRTTSAELTIVIGPVGGGKTTLLHAILKELPALKGSIQINGAYMKVVSYF